MKQLNVFFHEIGIWFEEFGNQLSVCNEKSLKLRTNWES